MSFKTQPKTLPPQPTSSVDYSLYLEEVKKENILIVDDCATIRSVFAKNLSVQYNCFEAESVNDAFNQLTKEDFALVITDVLMPGISGIELLRRIIENYPYTTVIIVSGVNNPKRALDAIRLGAFDYLIKPCELEVLKLTVERALEWRQLLLNARQYKIDLEKRNIELAEGKAELERLQAQIIQNEKMASIGQLTAGIAHELNNPVGFIYGNMDILNESVAGIRQLLDYYDEADLPENVTLGATAIKDKIDYKFSIEDLSSIIADCSNGAQRIRDIVQNLRTFSRLDETAVAKTNIHDDIDSSIRLLSRYYSSNKINLYKDYGNIPLIEVNAGQLNQVWMNLLVNAAQAISTNEGQVRIKTYTEEDSVVITISDSGCGIAPEHLNRIFDPFYTTKPVGEGTGLGLSISFGIVEDHGGSIKVQSVINKGTAFKITLPIDGQRSVDEYKES